MPFFTEWKTCLEKLDNFLTTTQFLRGKPEFVDIAAPIITRNFKKRESIGKADHFELIFSLTQYSSALFIAQTSFHFQCFFFFFKEVSGF